MKKSIVCFLIGMFSCLALWAKEKPLVVGTASAYAPFVSLNEKGEYEGFDIDLAEAIAEKLNRPMVIQDCGSMPSLMLALKQEKIDLILWGISITEERMQKMNMVYYQGDLVDEIPVIFWKEIPPNVKSLEDLNKGLYGVEAGSYQEDIFNTCSSLKLKYFDKVSDAILDLKYGKSMGSAIDPSILPIYLKKYPDLKVANLPLPKSLQSMGNGICINKANKELTERVEKAVKELTEEGKVAEFEKKWEMR